MSEPLTIDRVRELLSYDTETGALIWRVNRGRAKAGDVAGTIGGRGYRQVVIDGKRVLAHRLAWFISHGQWPSHEIDHRNGLPNDIRLDNLRDVSHAVNMQNQRRPRKASGILGVTKKRSRWRAQLCVNGKNLHLGTFDSRELAHEAYVRAKRAMHVGCTL